MPFEQPLPQSFTAAAIQAYAPILSGVYGISNAGEWIYIGETDNIREALLRHLRELNTAILQRQPTGFVFELCDQVIRNSRQDRLILEYEPTCNRHWSRHR
jgi:hypothetical protein